jgi:hypothetical protein
MGKANVFDGIQYLANTAAQRGFVGSGLNVHEKYARLRSDEVIVQRGDI